MAVAYHPGGSPAAQTLLRSELCAVLSCWGRFCISVQATRAVPAQSVLRIPGHEDDVNAVAFMEASPNIIASGSDDTLIKVGSAGSPLLLPVSR